MRPCPRIGTGMLEILVSPLAQPPVLKGVALYKVVVDVIKQYRPVVPGYGAPIIVLYQHLDVLPHIVLLAEYLHDPAIRNRVARLRKKEEAFYLYIPVLARHARRGHYHHSHPVGGNDRECVIPMGLEDKPTVVGCDMLHATYLCGLSCMEGGVSLPSTRLFISFLHANNAKQIPKKRVRPQSVFFFITLVLIIGFPRSDKANVITIILQSKFFTRNQNINLSLLRFLAICQHWSARYRRWGG